jgi:alpha-L-fucosidase
VLGVPSGDIIIKSLGKTKDNSNVKLIEMPGSNEKFTWKQNADSLIIQKPGKIPNDLAVVFKIYL